jgi:hypothetical protein
MSNLLVVYEVVVRFGKNTWFGSARFGSIRQIPGSIDYYLHDFMNANVMPRDEETCARPLLSFPCRLSAFFLVWLSIVSYLRFSSWSARILLNNRCLPMSLSLSLSLSLPFGLRFVGSAYDIFFTSSLFLPSFLSSVNRN